MDCYLYQAQPKNIDYDCFSYQNVIPSDSIKIKEYFDVGNDRDIIEYHSKKLASAVNRQLFDGAKPGTFIAILHWCYCNSDEEKNNT